MIIAGLWTYGDWRRVATGCTVLVRTIRASARARNTPHAQIKLNEYSDHVHTAHVSAALRSLRERPSTLANSPEDNGSEDGRTGKVEIDVEVGVKMIVLVLRLYLPALLTASVNQQFQ